MGFKSEKTETIILPLYCIEISACRQSAILISSHERIKKGVELPLTSNGDWCSEVPISTIRMHLTGKISYLN